jgi:hypothetical protein
MSDISAIGIDLEARAPRTRRRLSLPIAFAFGFLVLVVILAILTPLSRDRHGTSGSAPTSSAATCSRAPWPVRGQR